MFFTTTRLTLRPALPEDAGMTVSFRHAPDLGDADRFDPRFPPSVVLDSSGDEIGMVLTWPESTGGWRLEFALFESARGKGYAREMIRAWGHRFQQECPSDTLTAWVKPDDGAAESVLRFAGFELAGEGRYQLPSLAR